MSQFYERREKFEDIPELRPFPAEDLTVVADELVVSDEPNIQAYYREEDRNGITPDSPAFGQFQRVSTELGYTLLLPQYFAYGVAKLVQHEVVDTDELKVSSRDRRVVNDQYAEVSDRLNGEFDLHLAEGKPYAEFRQHVGRVNLLDEYLGNPKLRAIADSVSRLQLVIRYSNECARTVQQEGRRIFSVITHSPLDRNSLTLDVENDNAEPTSSRAYSDALLTAEELTAPKVAELVGDFKEKLVRREAAPRTSEFLIANTLSAKNMPHHPVFSAIKHQLEPRIFGHGADIEFDPMDLLYQVSFRLTCYELGEIFSDYRGGYVEPDARMMAGMTALHDYNLVRQFTGAKWGEYTLNNELIDGLIQEQLLLVGERYRQTNTDVSEVLGRRGILGQDGWYIINEDGRIFCTHDDEDGIIGVNFREIEPELARDYHATYHYIHAPRAKRSFGLFLEGSDTPFTIAGIDDVDRDYKKEALLLLGYDYENCVDFTRLYSLPGAPKLASSTISRMIKQQLLGERPNMQAAISTFMPTYANSNSMFACGFDKVFLLKRNRHNFTERADLGEGVYEQLTNRRAGNQQVITNKQILLPVVELLSEMKKPRFKPYVDINRSMMIRSDTK
ncbi:MAG TPA: hypothetical protein VFI74_05825 [Candidatus Saccharimonadales bacterium]|nr:hypothetical protein [Candidatus Saccharimonadales bacterium]